MIRAAALAALLAATGCATQPGCYVGFSLIPPTPILVCGLDVEPDDSEE